MHFNLDRHVAFTADDRKLLVELGKIAVLLYNQVRQDASTSPPDFQKFADTSELRRIVELLDKET